MEKSDVIINNNDYFLKIKNLAIFLMILRLLVKFKDKFNKYELETIKDLMYQIFNHYENDNSFIKKDKSKNSLINIINTENETNNIKKDKSKIFEGLDYKSFRDYLNFSLQGNYEKDSFHIFDIYNNFHIYDRNFHENKKVIDLFENSEKDATATNSYENQIKIDDNNNIDIEFFSNGSKYFFSEKNVNKNYDLTDTDDEKIYENNTIDFSVDESTDYNLLSLENIIDNKERDISTKDNNYPTEDKFELEISNFIYNYYEYHENFNETDENSIKRRDDFVVLDFNFKNADNGLIDHIGHNNIEFEVNSANTNLKEDSNFYSYKLIENKVENFSNFQNLKEEDSLPNIAYENQINYVQPHFNDRDFKYSKHNKDNSKIIFTEGIVKISNDFESEIKPCLDIDFNPEKIDNNKYSLLRGGLEFSVGEDDLESKAIFGVKDLIFDKGKTYDTSGNEISALLFKIFEERGVFLDFQTNNREEISLKDVNGTRIFIEDNEKVSVNNISYKIVVKDAKNNKEIKNVKFDEKLGRGKYIIDVIAEVEHNNRIIDGDNLEIINNNRFVNGNFVPTFSKMNKEGKKVRAYCLDECGFETNGKETILDQIIHVSKNNGYSLELKTMDTIANNKLRSHSLTYVKNIEGTVDQYLKIHPTAKRDKIGILYLVFDENNKILGEVGYRDEGLEYVAKKGLKIKPVIYEVGADIKDSYLEKAA